MFLLMCQTNNCPHQMFHLESLHSLHIKMSQHRILLLLGRFVSGMEEQFLNAVSLFCDPTEKRETDKELLKQKITCLHRDYWYDYW